MYVQERKTGQKHTHSMHPVRFLSCVSVCQMCLISNTLFEMYFKALCGNKPAVDYCICGAEVAQGCCAHQHLHLSHKYMHKTNVYLQEGQPFTAVISFMPFKRHFPFKTIWISIRCESIQRRIGSRNTDVLTENTHIQLRFPFFPPHQWKFNLFLL